MSVAKPRTAAQAAPKRASVAARAAKPVTTKAVRRPAPVKTAAKSAVKPVPVKTPSRKKVAVESATHSLKAQPVSTAAEAKPPKIKLVRDSFTIPRTEYEALDAIKARLIKLARPAKKSEVLRAGIAVLTTLNDTALLAALDAVPAIKTGRPKKAK